MNIWDYVIIAVISLCIVLAIAFMAKAKKSGRHIGCGNCQCCSRATCPKKATPSSKDTNGQGGKD